MFLGMVLLSCYACLTKALARFPSPLEPPVKTLREVLARIVLKDSSCDIKHIAHG